MRGNTDKPVEMLEKDEFQIEPYVTGLAEFIEECDTPMTIAIQGDWGCGKTSMMNMTRDYLKQKEHIVDVWFNTWQFSQFNMDSQLVVTFLQHLVNELSKNISDTSVRTAVFEKFVPVMKNITVGITKQFIGEDMGDVVENLVSKSTLDIVDKISELKGNFQELIMKATNAGERRVVIFIDDLDRLQPVRAVELLEILKLFVDCDNCVFVMAIDTSVVFQGIREKYGNDMSDEKAQSFFDKMIQMPFKMPIAYYRLNSMLERLLEFLQEGSLSEREKLEYITLFKKVTNGNLRSLKRLANSILLTEKVAEKKNIYIDEPEDKKLVIRKILVTLACIQLKYEVVYNFLVNDMIYKKMDMVLSLKIPGIDDSKRGDSLLEELVGIGMPDLEIEDKLVFYDVITLYIKVLHEYINCESRYGVWHSAAVKKLMQIVTVNNFVEDTEKETVQITERRVEEKSESLPGIRYLGMCSIGQHKEVYDQLTQSGIYLPLQRIRRLGDGRDVLKEYQKDLYPLENCVLFSRIDDILSTYDVEKKVDKREAITYITYTYTYQTSEIAAYMGAEVSARFEYSENERALYLCGNVTGRKMKPMEQTTHFVDNLLRIYQEAQELYTDKLIPKIDTMMEIEKNQEGEITKLSFSSLPVINAEMADAVIEYFTYVFKNMEANYRKTEWDYIPDDNPLLKLAAAVAGPEV